MIRPLTHLVRLAGALCLLALTACDDQLMTADPPHVQTVELPGRAEVDVLFVIDDGATMCQEQDALATSLYAEVALAEVLGSAVETRFAVVRATLDPDRGTPGALIAEPTLPVPSRCVDERTGEPEVPNTEACQALIADGALPVVVSSHAASGEACADGSQPTRPVDPQRLHTQLSCLATVGTESDRRNQGLEAMRLALDCNGPNRALFGPCCVDDGGGAWRYDPGCAPDPAEPGPRFLRPDAHLVVVFLADRDDCSAPADGPGDSVDACAWEAPSLTPIRDYYTALTRLKRSPLEQLSVVAITGPSAFTEGGVQARWSAGAPPAGCAEGEVSDACCPQGDCRGAVPPTCESPNGRAWPGDRYQAFAAAFDDRGHGCPPAAPDLPPDASARLACVGASVGADCALEASGGLGSGRCRPMEGSPELACAPCAMICDGDYPPLFEGRGAGARLVGTLCLDHRPVCQVTGADGSIRPCVGEEGVDPANYGIRVSAEAGLAAGGCPTGRELARSEWQLVLDEPICPSGVSLRLDDPPPVGATLRFEYAMARGGSP